MERARVWWWGNARRRVLRDLPVILLSIPQCVVSSFVIGDGENTVILLSILDVLPLENEQRHGSFTVFLSCTSLGSEHHWFLWPDSVECFSTMDSSLYDV